MATANLGRVVGSKWYVGDKITGTSTTPTIFSDSGISRAYTQDLYFNSSTDNVYECITAGTASVAEWVYVCNIKGNQPPLNDTLYSTSTTQALTANMGKSLFDKLLDSGVYAQEIIIENTNLVYSITTTVENKDSTLTFVSTSDVSKTYSVTKSGNAETQTLTITMQSLGFGSSGVELSDISSTENIYSITLKNSGGTAIVTINPSVWDKLNELEQQIKPGGNITDGEETLKEGVISRLINGAKTVLYPITHAKAVWFDKSNNKTVYDEIGRKLDKSKFAMSRVSVIFDQYGNGVVAPAFYPPSSCAPMYPFCKDGGVRIESLYYDGTNWIARAIDPNSGSPFTGTCNVTIVFYIYN